MAKRKTMKRQNQNEGQSVKYKATIRDVPIVVNNNVYLTDIIFKTVNKATADINRDGYKSNVFAYIRDNRVVVNYKKIFFSIKEKDIKKHTRKAVGVSMYAAIAEAVFNIYKNIDENGSHVHDICIDTIQTMRLLKYNERQIKSAQTTYLKNLLTCMDKYQKKTKDLAMFRYDIAGELEEDDEDDDDIWDEIDEDEEDEAPKRSKKKAEPAESSPKDEKPTQAEPEKDKGPETTTYVESADDADIEGDGSEMLAAHVLGGLPIGPAKDKNTQKPKRRSKSKGKPKNSAKNAS